ncbi:MAG: hypothetical protein U0236_07525 [Nitrospira sp.]
MMVPDAIRRLVAEQEDIEVVGDCRGPMKILQETGRTKADAVILAQAGREEPGICSQLLVAYPDLIIMSVIQDLTAAVTLQLASRRQEFLNLRPENAIDPLRAAMRMSRQSVNEG